MRVLLLSRYGPLGASSRVRTYQYLPYLSAHGIDVTIEALLGDEYVTNLYAGHRKNLSTLMGAYGRRLAALLRSRHFDLVWIQGEALPWLPAWVESLLTTGIRYMVDYDDALFHNYDSHQNPVVRRLLGRKIDTVMRNAQLVVVGNDYLAARARQAGARRVEYLPSVVDMERYIATPPEHQPIFTIGWVGTPVTFKNLQVIREALSAVLKDGGGRLIAVGAKEAVLDGIPMEVHTWSEATEVAEIQQFDVGVMPLIDGPFERGKCGYKLVQYMACGRPVVASPIGVNQQIVQDGINGFLAASTDDWVQALSSLRQDWALRQRMGIAARERAERHYSLQVAAPRLLSLFNAAVEPAI